MKSKITKRDIKFYNRRKAHTTSGKKYVNKPQIKRSYNKYYNPKV